MVNGAITGDIFRADVEPQLVTVLRPGDIVVMDNLSSHKVAGGRDALRAVGAEVSYVPPDSPELNPIGMLVSNVKGEIRKRQPRTKTGCDELCGECPDWFTPDECHNYIRDAGYIPQGRESKCASVGVRSADTYRRL